VAALRLTGRFRANDSAGLLAVLPSILPLRVRPQADGGVQLQAL
jgi:transmembrane sensor